MKVRFEQLENPVQELDNFTDEYPLGEAEEALINDYFIQFLDSRRNEPGEDQDRIDQIIYKIEAGVTSVASSEPSSPSASGYASVDEN